MEGQFTGSTALILPDRAGWEAITRPVSVLIGKFIKSENPYYYTDSPDLEHNFPDQAIELGASWYWDAKDLSKLPVRVFDAALDIPEGVAFEFPPPVRVPRASTRWSRPELSPDYPSTVAEKISAYSFHPVVYESLETFDAAFLSSPHKAKALAARTFMQSKLADPASRVLFQGYHRSLSRKHGALGAKIRNALRFQNRRTHKANVPNKATRTCHVTSGDRRQFKLVCAPPLYRNTALSSERRRAVLISKWGSCLSSCYARVALQKKRMARGRP